MFKLSAIIASTRPNRVGLPVARWFADKVTQHKTFALDLIDLAEVNLPPMDEPNHPIQRRYTQPHTLAWSQRVASADAFVFVTPEYNFSAPPALINAIDYLYLEWNYKALGFVSYGGMDGGTRSVQMLKQIATAVKMMPIPEAVHIPFVSKLIKEDGTFQPGDTQDAAVTKMLEELHRWTGALKTLRSF